MEMSPTIGALMGALAKAQATIGGAVKGKVNPAFKSKYADLASVWEAWQPAGPPNGLAVTQWPGDVINGKVAVTTHLGHASGEWMRETAFIPINKTDAQGYVSAVTYGRRCALSALAGIAPEDDDGNAAVAGRGAPTMASREVARGEWPNGPHTSKTALSTAWKELVRNLHGANDSDDVEGLITDAVPMLAQFRAAAKVGILTEDYHGGGDFKGVAATLEEARERVRHDDGVPREPGEVAGTEDPTTELLRSTLTDCETALALKAWAAVNETLIATQSETVKDELATQYKARARGLRAVAQMAA